METIFMLNGTRIDIGQDLTIGEGDAAITHPAKSLQDVDYRAALGIEDIVMQPRPDDSLFWVSDNGDGTFAATPKENALANLKSAAIKSIDADADAIYTAALGNRATEYAQAEVEAQIYKDAGYTGAVPAYVQAWATAKAQTAQWAADDILATASAWRTTQTAIRTHRLACKEAVRKIAAADDGAEALLAAVDALNVVKAQWAAIIKTIREQLGIDR